MASSKIQLVALWWKIVEENYSIPQTNYTRN